MNKNKILSLGSALLFLTNTLHAIEDISFGLKGGGSFFFSAMDTAKRSDNKEYEGNLLISPIGVVFFEYGLPEYMMSLGIQAGYAKRCIALTEKKQSGSNSDDKKAEDGYCLAIHALDITLPIAYLPMEREGGLSLFVALKGYIPLATTEKPIGAKDSQDADKELVRSSNFGGVAGARYEPNKSGFFLGTHYEYFIFDIFGDSQKAKDLKKDFGKKETDKFYPHGFQAYVGVDLVNLLDL